MSYALIHGMLGVFQLVWLKKEKKQRKGWSGSNPGHQNKRHPPFHYTTTVFASLCQVLIVLYVYILCFNSNKERGAIGDSNRCHQDQNRGPYQCAKPWFVNAVGNKYFYILLFLSQVFFDKKQVPDAELELSSKNEGALPLHHRWFCDNFLGCHYIINIMCR